jgi:uncharacterized membrane protein YdbT with pleckstrin-like domain
MKRPEPTLQPNEILLLTGGPQPEALLPESLKMGAVFMLGMVTAPLALLAPAVARQVLGWHQWWLTDTRIIVRTGFIGWSLRSIPLDRLVDVTTTASWWDRLFGLEHIVLRDMTGELGQHGANQGARLMAVADAHAVAEQILAASPRSAVGGDESMNKVVHLLEVLVAQAA